MKNTNLVMLGQNIKDIRNHTKMTQEQFSEKLNINPHFIMGIILAFIALQMFIEMLKYEKKELKIKVIYLLLFALSVSLDSFSTGIGLEAITTNYLLSSIVFSVVSFSFTYIGLILGKYSTIVLGKYAQILGILLLSIIGIVNLCQIGS